MRRLLPLLALVPLVAHAGVPQGADAVDIAGAVELPMLVAGEGVPAVMVTVPGDGADAKDQDFLAVVDVGSSQSTISPAMADALGLKKGKGKFAPGTAPVEYVVIPTLKVGEVTLHDLGALVAEGEAEMSLGFGKLTEVAVAVLPSRGIVKIVPAADATALLGEVGPSIDLVKPVTEPFYEHGEKMTSKAYLAVAGKIAGHEGLIALSTGQARTEADPFDASVAVRTSKMVDSPTLGGLTLAPLTVHRTDALVDPEDKLVGQVGWDGLHNLDLAFDPVGMKVAMKAAPAPKATPAQPALAERARKQYTDATAKAPEEAKEDEKAVVGQGDKGDAKKVSLELDLAPALAAARFSTAGNATEALTHYKAAADAAGDGCAAHQAYGVALMELGGDPTSALAELRRAAEAYDRWMAQDYFARGKIADGKNSNPDAFVIAQPASCNTAWGDLAEAYLALGDDEKVEQIYKEHADLDADLPLAYGYSLLRADKLADAIGPIRRAMELGRENDANVRTALYMTGDPAPRSAAGVERLTLAGVGEHLWTASPAIEAARAFGGNGEARKLAQALVEGDPMAVPARLLLAREVPDAERKDVLAGAEKALVAFRALQGDSVEADAWEGLYYAIDANNVSALTATSAEYAGNTEFEMASAIAMRDQGDLVGAKTRRNVLVKYHPLTPVTAIDSTRLDTRLPGLPGSPRPPLQAPAQTYTTSCAELPAASYTAPIAGTWVTTADTKDRVAFQADRWCVFDDTGAVRAKGGAASWSVYACPGEAPAADKPMQETYFVLRDTEHALTTCNRYVQVGDRIGMYGQACPGAEPFSTYGASARIGEWQRTQDKAPDACWIDAPPAPAPKKGK